MVETDMGTETNPIFNFTPANTDIDLFGLHPYPVQTNVPGDLDYNIIPTAVSVAEGRWHTAAGYSSGLSSFRRRWRFRPFILPTAAQATADSRHGDER